MGSLDLIVSKRIILPLIALILFFIAGCGSTQKVVSQTDTLDRPRFENDTLEVEILTEDSMQIVPVIDTFDIGLILPFHLDSVAEIPDSVDMFYSRESALAIEFYNGVKMAIDELALSGFKARVHVYDDANDKDRIMSITQLAAFKKMQLMLGPVYNNNLRVMAEYAKHDSVYLVSPLSPALNITSYNPYYVMVNPSLEAHCKKIFDYIIANHRHDNILILSRSGTSEAQYAAIFHNYLNEYKLSTNDYSIHFTQVGFSPEYGNETSDENEDEKEDLKLYFKESEKNIVIAPSVDKGYIHSVGRTLYQFVEPPVEEKDAVKYDVTVFGLPTWGDDEGLRLDYVQKLNVHFTTSYYVHPEFYSKDNHFYKKYVKTFQNEPTEYAIKGYDLMKYFGEMMQEHGALFDKMMLSEKKAGVHTDFQFGIHYAPESSTASFDYSLSEPIADFIENKYVHLLKYEGFELKKIE